MGGAAAGWKRFVPYETIPIIAAGIFVSAIAAYRLFRVSKQPEVRFTRHGGVHDWQEQVREEPAGSSPGSQQVGP